MSKIIFVLFTCLFAAYSLPVLAQSEQAVEIDIRTKEAPKVVLGIFFDSQRIVQQTNTSFERVNDETIVVKIPYDSAGLPSASSFVTAYVITEGKQILFGPIKMLSSSAQNSSFWKIPACPVNQPVARLNIPVQEQLSYLESLYQVRLKKRELFKNQIKEKLDKKTTDALEQIEQRFGLEYERPLTEETSALNLINRLDRIKETITLYKNNSAK